MFRRTADFVCRSSVSPAGILSAGKSCVTKIGKICSERQIYKKTRARHLPRLFGRGKFLRMRTKKMGAYAAPCMEENNEKMAALLVSIAYTGSRVDPAIIVSSECTSVKPSQKIATPALPCFRLANALYALLRAGFSCSARAAALRITCLVQLAKGHDRKKVSASSAAALLQ